MKIAQKIARMAMGYDKYHINSKGISLMKFYAIKKYERERVHDGLIDVSVTALFTTHNEADAYIKLTPDVELEIQQVQVSGSIDLGGLEVIRD